MVTAQGSLIPEGAPVDIHSGTCADYLTEPAYDAGDIETATTDDVWGDEGFMSGMLVDEAAGVSGVDMNGDGSLQQNEVVVLNGETAQIGRATGGFDAAVDTAEPWAVVVHASPDSYETAIACGDLSSARDVEGGRQLATLNPVGDSQLFGYAVLEEGGQSMNTYLFQPNPEAAAMSTPVQTGQLAPEGYPIEIHTGTCQDWTTEPAYDIGDMQQTNIAAPGEQESGDTSGDVPQGAEYLQNVYKVDTATDFNADEFIGADQPHVVAVHQGAGDNYTNLVACGQIVEVFDDDSLYVILQPVGTNSQTGFVEISGGDDEAGEVSGYLWNVQPFPVDAGGATPTPMPTMQPTQTPTPEPTATPTPEPTATPTPEPTPTEVATAVIEETEVVTETEVVPAPTATAQAEEEGN